jgi:glycosyltransferase involved in cell wall biosynthesis
VTVPDVASRWRTASRAGRLEGAALKVLWVLPYYEGAIVCGGPARSLPLLCRALAGQGAAVSVLSTNANGRGVLDVPLGRPFLSDGVEVTYYPRLMRTPFAFSPGLARDFARRCAGFDLVHTAGLYTFPSLAALRLAAGRGLPAVLSPKGELMAWSLGHKAAKKTAYLRLVGAGHLRRAAALLCSDEPERRAAAALGPPIPAYVVPNALDTASLQHLPPRGALRRSLRIPGDALLILCLGRLHPVKRPDLALQAFARLAAPFPAAHLLFAGPDEACLTPSLLAAAAQAGCAPRLHFAGLLDTAGVRQALADADLMLVASESESFGMAAAEAMAAGLPLVISERLGLARHVARCGAGRVTPLDATAMAAHLSSLLTDPQSLPVLGRQGQPVALELFGLEAVGRQLLAVYRRVLAAWRPPSRPFPSPAGTWTAGEGQNPD